MPRLASRDAIQLISVTLVVAGAIAAYPLYLPSGSAESRPATEPEIMVAHLQALIARIDRTEQQIGRVEQIQKAQERQDQTVALLRTQQEQTSDWIATASRQILDFAQYTSSGHPVTRQELEELKQTVSLSQQQINKLRGNVSDDLRRISKSNKAIGIRLVRLQKNAEQQKNAENRRLRSSKNRKTR